jgi:putative ABC transport system ATP-binding protein
LSLLTEVFNGLLQVGKINISGFENYGDSNVVILENEKKKKNFNIYKPTMIKTIDLVKVFRTDEVETTALNNVNITVEKGEFVAIMGPSGCGKSTLLNILGLLDTPDGGQYYFNGEEVARYKEKQRTNLRKGNIGFVFQSFNLIDELTVYENVELPLLYLKVSQSERRKKVGDVLERMKIAHRRKHFPQQLSGGQQQRVAIARSVVTRPQLILADEPTGNLDSVNGEEVMSLLTELNNEGTTIIMVTHSPSDADKAHRIVQLFDGHIVTENIRKIL